jgi:dihydroxyacetone kinase-like protein
VVTAGGVVTAEGVRRWICGFRDVIVANEAELTDLDRQTGDGDFGTNITAVLNGVTGRLDAGETRAAGHFATLASGFMNGGGTSGPLFGIWFQGFASACARTNAVTARELADGAESGLAGVCRLGGAQPGDKTLVDAMNPAASALRVAADRFASPAVALVDAAQAARTGAIVTASYSARRGRASYVGAAAHGVLDPGALAVALFFESAVKADLDDAVV